MNHICELFVLDDDGKNNSNVTTINKRLQDHKLKIGLRNHSTKTRKKYLLF